jgi:DNA-binding transcriptional LysR family regulator
MLRDTSLLYFYEVARLGSIRQAAENLHVSPSAISRMITQAEHQFQAALFERRPKGMILTEAGEILAEKLRGVVTQLRDARVQIDELKGLKRGEVSLYCIEGIVQDLIPSVIAEFHRKHPLISFLVNTGGSDAIVEALVTDKADIGIAFNMRSRSDTETLFTFDQQLCAVLSPEHPLAVERVVSLHRVVLHPIAMPDSSFGVRGVLDRALRTLRLEAPLLVTTNSLSLTWGMARSGAAVTLSPPFAAAGDLASGRLVAVPIEEGALLSGTMSVCKHKGRPLSVAATELLSHIRRAFDKLDHGATKPPKGRRRVPVRR